MTEAIAAQEANGRGLTLDGLFRRVAVRNPDAVALIDPGNRAWFTDGAPLTLTFSQADRIVWAIAARLHALGLRAGDVVAVQLPNTAENVLTLLGLLRGGLVAAPLPMLWREKEIVAALSAASAKAIITAARIGEADHCSIAMKAAAELFSIRHVCAFGEAVPDGVTPMDDVLSARGYDVIGISRGDNPAAQTAIITFDVTARGITAIARAHTQVIAGGVHVASALAFHADAAILSATPPSSFAGLCVTLAPMLIAGSRLILHQPFDAALFAETMATQRCDGVVLPGAIADHMRDRGLLRTANTVIAVWRHPERAMAGGPTGDAAILDVRAFGEAGLIATPRGGDGTIAPFGADMLGSAIEFARSQTGTLTVRGPMTPAPPGRFADTGYPCRADAGHLVITGPRPGTVGVGGYAIPRSDLDALATVLAVDELITPLPDGLLGQRLAASAARSDDVESRLGERGVSPLIAGAFRPRRAA